MSTPTAPELPWTSSPWSEGVGCGLASEVASQPATARAAKTKSSGRGQSRATEGPILSYECTHEEGFAVEWAHFKKIGKRTRPKKVEPFSDLEEHLPVLVSPPPARCARFDRSR